MVKIVKNSKMKAKNNFVKIKKAGKKGIGLFAGKNFKKGEAVYSFPRGKIIKKSEIKKLISKEKKYLDYYRKGEYEIMEPPARCVNHSCDPNIIERNRIAYTIKPIKKGDEITIDYRPIGYREKPFKCYCGSKKCVKLIMGNDNLCYCESGKKYEKCCGK
ncbi:MAG: SET domain-containing protein-lysine N-methyltransferase [Patescibacteria group bacterium]